MNDKDMRHIIQTTHSILTIPNEIQNPGKKIQTPSNLKKILQNTEFGIKLNFQCDEAIKKFKEKYNF